MNYRQNQIKLQMNYLQKLKKIIMVTYKSYHEIWTIFHFS